MKRSFATLAIPLAALGLLGVTACGDDDDSPSTTESGGATLPGDSTVPDDISVPSLPGGTLPGGITIPSLPDLSVPGGSLPDTESILRQVFPNLDDDQVSCLADALGDIGSDFDPSQVMNVLGGCNIPISDLTPGG